MENNEYSRKCKVLRTAMALAYAMKPKKDSYEKIYEMNMENYDRAMEAGSITSEEYEFLKQENTWAYNKVTHKNDKWK